MKITLISTSKKERTRVSSERRQPTSASSRHSLARTSANIPSRCEWWDTETICHPRSTKCAAEQLPVFCKARLQAAAPRGGDEQASECVVRRIINHRKNHADHHLRWHNAMEHGVNMTFYNLAILIKRYSHWYNYNKLQPFLVARLTSFCSIQSTQNFVLFYKLLSTCDENARISIYKYINYLCLPLMQAKYWHRTSAIVF